MSDTPQEPGLASSAGGLISFLVRRKHEVAMACFGVAVLFLVFTIYMARRYGWDYASVCIWSGGLTILAIGAGVTLRYFQPPESLSEGDAARLLVLTVGGLAGLLTIVLAIGLTYKWWEYFRGGLETWRKEWQWVSLCVLALFGGMALMFVSVQLARPEAHSKAGMRRLAFGSNVIVAGLLLLAVLFVVNSLFYVKVGPFKYLSTSTDWTASTIYTLSPASRGVLENLDKPVHVYVMLPRQDPAFYEFQNLMDNCLEVTDKLQVEYISPDRSLDRVIELAKKYHFLEGQGILVTYGSDENEQNEFINRDEIGVDDFRGGQFKFQGEDVLITKLKYLLEGKSRPIVYFTQGNGELDLNQSGMGPRDRGLGILKERLQKANYDVRPLKLDVTVESVPDDAAAVIVVGPTTPLPDAGIKALGDYMNATGKAKKNGKLIVLLDAPRDESALQTGLEKFLLQFRIQVGNDRILIVPNNFSQYPLEIMVVANPLSNNKVAEAFREVRPFRFRDVRTMTPQEPAPDAPPSSNHAEPILFAPEGITWADTNLAADPKALVDSLWKPDRRRELGKRVSRVPLPVAVAVTAPRAASSADPHAFMRQQQEPRLLAFGNAGWLSNRFMVEGSGTNNYELFASSLSWVRERPDIGKNAAPKERTFFTLGGSPDSVTRLYYVPLLLILITIAGLGAGIWLVRRR